MDDEKQCSKCLDWWPKDSEFYHREAKITGGLAMWCKACWSEYRAARRTRGTAS